MSTIDATRTLASPSPSDVSSSIASAEDRSALDRDAFMKLLIAQIQHQDPLDPMDPTESISQLAELTGVEQMVSIERRLSALEVAAAGLANTQVAGLVGRTVTADASTLRLSELGSASGAFTLDAPVDRVTVAIRDADGEVVRTLDLPAHGPGVHEVHWDGRDDAGARLPPGRYRMEVSAVGAEGGAVEPSTRVTGSVTAVTYEDGYAALLLGDLKIVLGDVVSIAD